MTNLPQLMSETPRTDALTGTFYLRCDECPQPDRCERMKSVHPDDVKALERELAAVEAKLRECEKDAERWRILVDKSLGPVPTFSIHYCIGHDWCRAVWRGELQSVIDAAREEK